MFCYNDEKLVTV